jgi:pyruvate/2-oxoglutarate dehydrogenase complex dihydrolipoamide acyltransferase (E2) component
MQSSPKLNTPWRKTAATIYQKPTDSKILGSVEIDITDLEKYISQKRKEGLKVTLTHIFTLATARAAKTEVPQLNTYIKRGDIHAHPSIDAAVSVLLNDDTMSSVKLQNADTLTLKEAVENLTKLINQSRGGVESKTMKNKDMLANIPYPFRNWVFAIIKKLIVDWGFELPRWGLSANNFGSFMVSNIGSLGLDIGFPALFPAGNVSIVLILGGVSKQPLVINDEIQIRSVIKLGIAIDHRLLDASHGGKLFRFIKKIVRNPELLEQS